MTVQVVYLKDYDWLIKVFYEVTTDDSDVILSELDDIDCPSDIYYNAADMLEVGDFDTGFTYTSSFYRTSFIIMMQSSCADEFQNTFDHEKGHAAHHIASELDLDKAGEEIQYLQGEIGKEMFKVAKRFMCDHCRVNIVNYGKVKMKFY